MTVDVLGPPAPTTPDDATGHLYDDPAWLRVEGDVAATPPRTFTAVHGGCRASLVSYSFDGTSNPWRFARPDLLLADLGVPGATTALPGVLVGGRRPGHSRITLTGGSADDQLAAGAAVVAEATGAVVEAGARSVTAAFVEDERQGRAFARQGFGSVPSHSRWELPVPPGGFDDYVATLPAQARRNVRKERRDLHAAGTVSAVLPLADADLEELVDLELCSYARHGNDYRTAEAFDLHEAVLRHLPGRAFVCTVRDTRRRLLSFAVLVVSGSRGYLRQGGIDQELAGGLPAYFDSAFYTPVQFAQGHGLTVLDLSIGSGRGKHLRGCLEVPTTAWTRRGAA